jgi:hypothetical protein
MPSRDRIRLSRPLTRAGAGSTSAPWSSGASACGSRSGAWARSCAGSALPACRRARATRRATPKPKRYIKNFADLVRAALPETALGKPLEIWFQDEARVGQQGTLTRLWARKGTRPRAPKDCRYAWAYIFGAVCPARATGAALVMPHANTEAMNAHLAEISLHVASGAHAILVLDGAGWHSSPPPGTMPSSTAARVAWSASSTRSLRSFTSTSVAPPTLITATPPASLARRSCSFSRS